MRGYGVSVSNPRTSTGKNHPRGEAGGDFDEGGVQGVQLTEVWPKGGGIPLGVCPVAVGY